MGLSRQILTAMQRQNEYLIIYQHLGRINLVKTVSEVHTVF